MSAGDAGAKAGSALASSLLDQSRELQAVTDHHGRLLWVNRAFRQAIGWLAPIGANLPDRLASSSDQHGAAWQQKIAAALPEGELADTVLSLPSSANVQVADRPIWLRLRISGLADHRLWTLTDISAEHQLRSRLQRLEELLDTAQEFGRLGVWERDLATGRGRWDDHVFRFWGLDPSAGTPSFVEAMQRIHPDDRASRDFAESARQAGRYSQRFRVMQADGTLRWLHSHWEIKAAPDGTPTHAVGVMVDDSETIAMARQLSEATAKLTIAVELGEIVIFEQDLRTDRIALNARGCEILGVPFSEHGMPIAEFEQLIHPDDREEMRAAGVRALIERRPVDLQVRYRRADGQWLHLLSRRALQRDAMNRPLAFVGVALDVTARVEAQRAFDETARGLEIATMAAGVGIWSRDTTSGEGQWNAQMFTLNGRDPQRGPPSRKEWLTTMIHPDDRSLMATVRSRLSSSPDRPCTSEYRIIRPDGSIRWLVEMARKEQKNGRLMIFGATLDITDRKHAELALRKANERIVLATRGAGIGTWEHDLNTDEVRWDEQMFLMRGRKVPGDADQQARAARELHKKLTHPDDLARIDDADRRSMVDGSMASEEYRVRWPDGSYRWLASRSIPMRDDSGHTMRQIGVEWDVHERVMADEIRREAQVAQRQSEAKAALLARMSHELRTPLNAILGFTDLLTREATPGAPGHPIANGHGSTGERLTHIRNAAERLLELVDDVLDLSKIETGELRLQPQDVELSALLREIVDLNGQKARLRSIRLHLKAESVTALADPIRLRQIVSKLVGHHVGTAPNRGEIDISVAADGDQARITIGDRGVGLAAHQLELFTSPRFLAAGPNSDQDLDFGLFGSLLSGMKGRIERRREDSGEDRIVIWLPLAKSPKTTSVKAEPQIAPGRTARVLYIEDNPVNVILVEELIGQRGGIDFCSEANGHDGVARAIDFRPDLILIDIHLPDIDGFEVLRRVRANEQIASTCCVALSANAMPEDVARARAAGFDDYWTKPIRFASFLAGLNRLLPGRPPA